MNETTIYFAANGEKFEQSIIDDLLSKARDI
jgi:hypothetical protein